jgi:hypothetical protein
MRPALAHFLLASPALAEGFAVSDLSTLSVDPAALLGEGHVARAEPARLSLACLGCADLPAVDVLLGRQDDGTEGRVRSGETTVADLQALCRSRDPTCRIEALDVAPAVGWISAHEGAGGPGSTAIVLRDGDLLTIRSLAGDVATARANAEAVIAGLGPLIIGD